MDATPHDSPLLPEAESLSGEPYAVDSANSAVENDAGEAAAADAIPLDASEGDATVISRRLPESPAAGEEIAGESSIVEWREADQAPSAEGASSRPRRGRGRAAEALIGQSLDHFQILEMVGGGGMGTVFRARDQRLDRIVAVKVIPAANQDPEMLRRFKIEAQSAARLDHPHIARVYYVGEVNEWNYIVFEYVDGINLRDLVLSKGPLGLDEAVWFTRQVAEALTHAAARYVVHRDIKPSNVLVTKKGTVKLVDMGLARTTAIERTSNDLTASNITLGTFDYISPEQARDPRTADVRSDLYSLGCTLYFLLSGRPPFPDGTALQKLMMHDNARPVDIRQYRVDLPDELAAILNRLMAKNPNHRYQEPLELINDFYLLAEFENLPKSRQAGTVSITPAIQEKSVFESLLPWMVALGMLAGVALWMQSMQGGKSMLPRERIPYAVQQSAIAATVALPAQSVIPPFGTDAAGGRTAATRSTTNRVGSTRAASNSGLLAADESSAGYASSSESSGGVNGQGSTRTTPPPAPPRDAAPPPRAGVSAIAANTPTDTSARLATPDPTGATTAAAYRDRVPTATEAAAADTTLQSAAAVDLTQRAAILAEALAVGPSAESKAAASRAAGAFGVYSSGYLDTAGQSDPALGGRSAAVLEASRTVAINPPVTAEVSAADVAALASDGGPWIIVDESAELTGRTGRQVVRTLQEAFSLASSRPQSREIVLMHPVQLTMPLVWEHPNLTLRSGRGRAKIGLAPQAEQMPQFEYPAGSEMQCGFRLAVGQSLRLIDVDIELVSPESSGGVVSVFAAAAGSLIQLDRCSVTLLPSIAAWRSAVFATPTRSPRESLRPKDASLQGFESASATNTPSLALEESEGDPVQLILSDCVVRGGGDLLIEPHAVKTVLNWQNGLLAVDGRFVEYGGAKAAGRIPLSIRLQLQGVTAAARRGFARLQYEPATDNPACLYASMISCVFLTDADTAFFEFEGVEELTKLKATPLDAAIWARWLDVSGIDNAYDTSIRELIRLRSQGRILARFDFESAIRTILRERSPEASVRWVTPPSPSALAYRQTPAQFLQRPGPFQPGMRAALLPPLEAANPAAGGE